MAPGVNLLFNSVEVAPELEAASEIEVAPVLEVAPEIEVAVDGIVDTRRSLPRPLMPLLEFL